MPDLAEDEQFLADLAAQEEQPIEQPVEPVEDQWSPPEHVPFGEEKVPWEKAHTWMQQGRNYSQRAAELNRQIEEARAAAIEEERRNWSHFDEVNRYAQEHPEWWQHVQEKYQARDTHGMDPQTQSIIQPLMERLNSTEQVLSEFQKEREAQEAEKANKALDDSIQKTKEAYPQIDFDAPDESGIPLEYQILDHMQKSGIASFKAASLDYLSDQLPTLFKTEEKIQAQKVAEANAKRGVVKTDASPGQLPEIDVRGKSYDQITDEIIQAQGLK